MVSFTTMSNNGEILRTQVVSDAAWDAFVTNHSLPHILQTSGWAALKAQFGWEAERVALVDGAGAIRAGAEVLFRRVAGLTIAYVPRGPLTDWDNRSMTQHLLGELTTRAQARDAALLKLEPELFDTADELMIVTGARDGFAVHDADYYAAAYELLAKEHGAFFVAEYEGQPLAAIVVFVVGRMAWYLWGASSNRERNRMPNHALQWAAMQWAKEQGASCYDFWGIPDELGQLAQLLATPNAIGAPPDALPVDLTQLPSEGLWGVYRFKQGFGGEVVRYVGAWDKPLQSMGYRAYQLGLALREQPARMRELDPVRAVFSTISRRGPAGSPVVRPITEPRAWQQVLSILPDPHVLQSWEWGEVKAQSGWHAERLVVPGAKATPASAFQFLWRQPVARAALRVAYVPKGPVIDWANAQLVEQTLAQIEAYAHDRGCLFVKIDPDVRADTSLGRQVMHTLFRRGWRVSPDQIQFKNTAYSDLTLSEEELLSGMKSKWRYNIRLARRRNVTVRVGGEEELSAFYDLYAETSARDGFLIRPFDYYRMTWSTYLAAEADETNPAGGALLLAEHPEERDPVAGLFLMRYGERSWYFYGASSERRRRDMPNYLLQWEAMCWSKARGCTVYDWWGAPSDLDDEEDAMQSVWRFKQGFGAEFQPHIGAWDFAISPPLYQGYVQAMPKMLDVMRRRYNKQSE
jgi:peptidoglycan pentaglycine glycine transferase (the first glycine)